MALTAAVLAVPPNTPESAPVRFTVFCGAWHLTGVAVKFPDGCLDAVGFRLMDGGVQIAPIGGGWMYGNDESIAWSEDRILSGPPYTLIAECYSLALDYYHTLKIRATVTNAP